MKMVKKIVVGLVITLVLLIGAGVAITYFYGDDVKQYIVQQLNKQLNTEIKVKDIQFSVLKNFPFASIEFTEVLAKDATAAKEKDTLFYANKIFLLFNIKDIYYKNYNIKKIIVSGGNIKLKVDEQGNDNYHFWKTTQDTGKTAFAFALNKILLENLHVSFTNFYQKREYKTNIERAVIKGKFSDKQFLMELQTQLFVEHIEADDIRYLSKKPVEINVNLAVDNKEHTYLFNKGEIKIADLQFNVDGQLQFNEKSTQSNLTIDAKKMQLETFAELLPEKFATHLKSYDSKGIFYSNLKITGEISATKNPSVEIQFGIINAEIMPPKSKHALKKITLKGFYTNGKEKNLASSSVDCKNFSASWNEKPITADFSITDFSNPFLTLSANANVAVADVVQLFKLDTFETINGDASVNANFEGRIHDLSGENFAEEKIKSSGELSLSNVNFKLKNNSQEFNKFNGHFSFKGKDIVINNFSGVISKTDFQLDGILKNIFGFIFLKNQDMIVDGNLYSRVIDLNELLQNKKEEKDVSNKEYVLFFSPALDCNLKVTIGELRLQKFLTTGIKGNISIKNGILNANPLTFNTMDGFAKIQGTIDASRHDSILIACNSLVKKININKLFYQLDNFGQGILLDKNLRGDITADIQFVSLWSSKLQVDLDKIYVRSSISIDNGELLDFKPLLALSKFVKVSELKDIKFSTLKNQIEIKNQKIYIPSMEIKSNALNLTASGVHTFDNEIDYKIKLLLSDLLGKKAREKNTEFGEEEDDGLGHTRLFLSMKGTIEKPIFSYDKKAVIEKIKADIKTEKQTMKSVLKNEFGWFKKDTLLNPTKEVKKDVIEIDWEDYNKKETTQKDSTIKGIKKSSKTGEERKNAFEKFKKKVLENNE